MQRPQSDGVRILRGMSGEKRAELDWGNQLFGIDLCAFIESLGGFRRPVKAQTEPNGGAGDIASSRCSGLCIDDGNAKVLETLNKLRHTHDFDGATGKSGAGTQNKPGA